MFRLFLLSLASIYSGILNAHMHISSNISEAVSNGYISGGRITASTINCYFVFCYFWILIAEINFKSFARSQTLSSFTRLIGELYLIDVLILFLLLWLKWIYFYVNWTEKIFGWWSFKNFWNNSVTNYSKVVSKSRDSNKVGCEKHLAFSLGYMLDVYVTGLYELCKHSL